MSSDVRLLIMAAIGLGFFAWALSYSSQFGTLVSSTTGGYSNVVRALEPPSMSGGPTSTISPGMG